MQTVKLIYGNHPGGAVQIEDFLGTLTGAFRQMGVRAEPETRPSPGCLNVVLEYFDEETAAQFEALGPDTKLVIIATEFVTHGSFNDFGSATGESRLPRWLARYRKPRVGRTPGRRVFYWGQYENRKMWNRRFGLFKRVARRADSVWCLLPEQLDGYRDILEDPGMLHWLRYGYSQGSATMVHLPDSEKDLDFLFTGNLTPYRESILEELRTRGYKVDWLPPHTPGFVRETYLGRAKVCLNLKQSPNWKYHSINRFHYHLVYQSFLVSERTPIECELTPYVTTDDSEDFVGFCQRAHAEGRFADRAREAMKRYADETSMSRNLVDLLRSSMQLEFDANRTRWNPIDRFEPSNGTASSSAGDVGPRGGLP